MGNLIEGNIPYVSRSCINNGITRMCGNINLLNPKNTITIHAEWKQNYCAFFQDEDYVTDGMVAFLSSENLNKYNGLFIATLLSKLQYDGTGLMKSLNNLLIELPATNDGEPDWVYMENKVRELENKVRRKLYTSLPKLKPITTLNWREYKVGQVLQRVKIKSISPKIKLFTNGHVNVIGNTSINNGVIKRISISDIKYIHKSNCLSYGAKGGKFFYQKESWVSTDHVHMFVAEELNEYNQIFICTVLNKIIESKGGWSSSLESDIVDEIVKLPSTNDGEPDWVYMEKYIKNEI